eukprot:COSAG06_NODE_18492_length_885_cov_0.880407_2_plen_56_part_00
MQESVISLVFSCHCHLNLTGAVKAIVVKYAMVENNRAAEAAFIVKGSAHPCIRAL